MRTRTDWTPERDEELRRLWATGRSTRLIGLELGVTKNAVVGRSHRLDLPARRSVVTTRNPKPVQLPVKQQIRRPLVVVRKRSKMSGGVSLAALRDGQCKWPRDDGLFCGQPVVRGPYCQKHADTSYVEAKKPTRSATYPIRKRWR